jgi:hypothetical protein
LLRKRQWRIQPQDSVFVRSVKFLVHAVIVIAEENTVENLWACKSSSVHVYSGKINLRD